jgi:hypothetical protein
MSQITKQNNVKGHRVLQRDRQAWYQRLYQDYFLDNPAYGHYYFQRRYVTLLILFIRYFKNINSTYMCFIFTCRFRMRRSLFVRIWIVVKQHDHYFVQTRNTAGTLGLSSLQKVLAAFRMLSYGVVVDATNDYVRIGEGTTIESLRRFVCDASCAARWTMGVIAQVETIGHPTEHRAVVRKRTPCGILHGRLSWIPLRDRIMPRADLRTPGDYPPDGTPSKAPPSGRSMPRECAGRHRWTKCAGRVSGAARCRAHRGSDTRERRHEWWIGRLMVVQGAPPTGAQESSALQTLPPTEARKKSPAAPAPVTTLLLLM